MQMSKQLTYGNFFTSILWKRTVSAEFRVIAETAFLQIFHTRKLGEITVFDVILEKMLWVNILKKYY